LQHFCFFIFVLKFVVKKSQGLLFSRIVGILHKNGFPREFLCKTFFNFFQEQIDIIITIFHSQIVTTKKKKKKSLRYRIEFEVNGCLISTMNYWLTNVILFQINGYG